MNKVTKLLAQVLLIASLTLPWTVAEAAESTFERTGTIASVGISDFVIRGQKYRIAPGAKLLSKSKSRKKFADFRRGDEIYFKGKVVNGVFYVDYIFYSKTSADS